MPNAKGSLHSYGPCSWRELGTSGTMDTYAARLRPEFGSTVHFRPPVVDDAASGLRTIDPAVLELCKMKPLGHELLLSGGLKKLLELLVMERNSSPLRNRAPASPLRVYSEILQHCGPRITVTPPILV